MTLITVVCYDFAIFSRSKSRILEKSTLSPRAVIFRKFRREKIYLPIFVPPFLRLSKLCEVKTEFIRLLREQTFSRRQKPNFREF